MLTIFNEPCFYGSQYPFQRIFLFLFVLLFANILCIITYQPSVVQVTKIVEKQVTIKVPVKLDINDKKQIKCLAENTYFEAGNQPTQGKIAVNNVVMNRVGNFAATPCGVVKQKTYGVCQFSWVCTPNKVIKDINSYMQSYKIAENVYLNNINDVTHGAKFFHATSIKPEWSKHYHRTVQIGDHIFYKND